jgi:glycerol-3-phosphate dehydrogenase
MTPENRFADCDLLVVGGGINGVGIARDAAGRGLSVVLCEQDDLGAHTSSASTKLIHGGLRYLEHGAFGLVRKALREREVLLRNAPHLIRPLTLTMPHDAGMRPAWMIRAGLFLYDHLARRELLPASQAVDLDRDPSGLALKPAFRTGFRYADGWVDDARLVIANALDAAARGARILPRTRCIAARRAGEYWEAELLTQAGERHALRARCLVNAAGPWAGRFLHDALRQPAAQSLRLVKGSHIVVRRRLDQPHAYLFQHTDRRVIFALPYENGFTLIGTTDVDYQGDPAAAAITPEEVAYLCAAANRYLLDPVVPADVAWTFAGVRPLLEQAGDPASVTRDYALGSDPGQALVTVWGGKLTTYRLLAEQAVERVAAFLHRPGTPWTAAAALPGGDFAAALGKSRGLFADRERFGRRARKQWPWLPEPVLQRWLRAYGTRIEPVLGGARRLAGLGEELLPGLYEAEARYWMREEWAMQAGDMLWRRSKIGLQAGANAQARLQNWLDRQAAAG